MRRRLALLVPIALGTLGVLAACMPDAPAAPETLGGSSDDIVNGTASPKFQDSVVFIDDATAQASCSGTIIAPTLVLTARHCVSEIDDSECGAITANSPAGGISVQTGAKANGESPDARATKIFYPAGDTDVFCGNDLAIIQVDTPLAPRPRPLRFTAATVGEIGQAVGYGLDANGQDPGGRFQRTGMKVLALGGSAFDFTRQDGTTTPVDVASGMLLTSEGACEGDSGGPLFDANGNIIGTVTGPGLDEDSCTDMVDLYTALAGHEDQIRQVFQTVGATMPPPFTGDPFAKDAGPHDGGHHHDGGDGGHHHDGGWDGGHHHHDDGGGGTGGGDDDDDDNGNGTLLGGSVATKSGADKASGGAGDDKSSSGGTAKGASAGCSAAPGEPSSFGLGVVWALGLLAARRRYLVCRARRIWK
jgi:uncharacterized protein (TIGR03382 family)